MRIYWHTPWYRDLHFGHQGGGMARSHTVECKIPLDYLSPKIIHAPNKIKALLPMAFILFLEKHYFAVLDSGYLDSLLGL